MSSGSIVVKPVLGVHQYIVDLISISVPTHEDVSSDEGGEEGDDTPSAKPIQLRLMLSHESEDDQTEADDPRPSFARYGFAAFESPRLSPTERATIAAKLDENRQLLMDHRPNSARQRDCSPRCGDPAERWPRACATAGLLLGFLRESPSQRWHESGLSAQQARFAGGRR